MNLKPSKLDDIMPGVRIKQQTPFGTMHVKVIFDTETKEEKEIFAQMGKAGELLNSHLEAICRLASIYLRVGGSIQDIIKQLEGIGSSLNIPSNEKITSIPDALAKAIKKYLNYSKNLKKKEKL